MRLLGGMTRAGGVSTAAARAGRAAARTTKVPPPAAPVSPPVAAASPPPSSVLAPPVALKPRVTDGLWSSTDAQLMREALDDAERVVTTLEGQADEAAASAGAPVAAADAAGPKPKKQQPSRRALAQQLFSKTLLGRSPEELRALAAAMGQPAYRGQQLYDALVAAPPPSPPSPSPSSSSSSQPAPAPPPLQLSTVQTLPKAFRERLTAEGWTVGRPVVSHEAVAPDGTRKLLLRLADGHEIETVGIPVDGDDGDDDGMSGGMSSVGREDDGDGGGGRRAQAAASGARGGGNQRPTTPGSSSSSSSSSRPSAAAPLGTSSSSSAPQSSSSRLTCCVSTMAGGCPLRCSFCATGRSAFSRNLAPHEILAQAMAVRDAFGGRRVSRVVFMGGGEPLVNLPSVLEAVAMLRRDMGLSGRAITISTVGVPNTIARLAEARLPCTLAVSLHAPSQALREKLVPSARAYPLDALMRDCAGYFVHTGRRVTFEYTLMRGENDSPEHARELAALLKRHGMLLSSSSGGGAGGGRRAASSSSSSSSLLGAFPSTANTTTTTPAAAAAWGGAHVNLIPYNSVDGTGYERPSRTAVFAFRQALQEAAGRALSVSVRATRGEEASAACGQLAYKANEVRVASAGGAQR
jgi:adenine C2-methylase RlmN of 23S rRNA A2503 and tRNA A37